MMRSDPLKGSPRILKSSRKRVFWGESVLDGNSYKFALRNEKIQVTVMEEREGGFETETSGMVIH